MKRFQIEQPVDFTDAQNAYLDRQLHSINHVLGTVNYFAPVYNLPNKPRIGLVLYFAKEIEGTDITDEGLWIYTSQGWQALLTVPAP